MGLQRHAGNHHQQVSQPTYFQRTDVKNTTLTPVFYT